MLITFAFAMIVESTLQFIWTADFRRYETAWGNESWVVGSLYVPKLQPDRFPRRHATVRRHMGVAALHLCRPRACALAPRMRRSPPRSASIIAGCRSCCRAFARLMPVSPACSSRWSRTLAPSQIWSWVGVVFAVVIIGRLGNPIGALAGGDFDRRVRSHHHGRGRSVLGIARVLLRADRASPLSAEMGLSGNRLSAIVAAALLAAALIAMPGDSASPPTTWPSSISSSSGYRWRRAGRFCPVSPAIGASVTPRFSAWASTPPRRLRPSSTCPFCDLARGCLHGSVARYRRRLLVFRLQRLRGELFALMTISVTFVVATIVSNTPIDGGSGVYLISVALPEMFGSPNGDHLHPWLWSWPRSPLALAYWVYRSKMGLGLFAIHDDEDVAEVKGVPTFRYKLAAFALSSGIAGAVGGVYSIYVSYVTVGETFEVTVIMYPVVMSIFGGSRHWLGPALGAIIVTTALYGFAAGPEATLVRGGVALGLIVVVLLLPQWRVAQLAVLVAQALAALGATVGVASTARSTIASQRRRGGDDDTGAAVPRRLERIWRRAGAQGRDARCTARRNPRSGRSQRLGQIDLDQRHHRPFFARSRRGHFRRRAARMPCQPMRWRASALRVPIKYRGHSTT